MAARMLREKTLSIRLHDKMEGGVRCSPGPEIVFSMQNHFLNMVDGISILLRLSYDNLKIQ